MAPVLGIHPEGETLLDICNLSFADDQSCSHIITAAIGIGSLIFLFWVRSGLKPVLIRFGLSKKISDILVKVGPVIAIIVTIIIVCRYGPGR